MQWQQNITSRDRYFQQIVNPLADYVLAILNWQPAAVIDSPESASNLQKLIADSVANHEDGTLDVGTEARLWLQFFQTRSQLERNQVIRRLLEGSSTLRRFLFSESANLTNAEQSQLMRFLLETFPSHAFQLGESIDPQFVWQFLQRPAANGAHVSNAYAQLSELIDRDFAPGVTARPPQIDLPLAALPNIPKTDAQSQMAELEAVTDTTLSRQLTYQLSSAKQPQDPSKTELPSAGAADALLDLFSGTSISGDLLEQQLTTRKRIAKAKAAQITAQAKLKAKQQAQKAAVAMEQAEESAQSQPVVVSASQTRRRQKPKSATEKLVSYAVKGTIALGTGGISAGAALFPLIS